MRYRWRELFLTGAALTAAQAGAAQRIHELGIETIVTSSDPVLAVLAPFAALRTSGRSRVSAAVGAGVSDGDLAWRAELLGHFLFSPHKRRSSGFYLAGGVAAAGGPVSRGYLVLVLGLENRPRGRSGWALEAGIGGGIRVAIGYRWRWFPTALPQ
jgi:hypothetical protein